MAAILSAASSKTGEWNPAYPNGSRHPASKGLAERAVKIFKEGMKKIKEGSVETRVSRFLSRYRITPQTSTGVSPAELSLGRKPRSR